MKSIMLVLTLLALNPAGIASANFWDQGFTNGYSRPEIASLYGTFYPVTYGNCLFGPPTPCESGPAYGSSPTYLTFPQGASGSSNYWALHINNEPAFYTEGTSNPGIPGRTHPLYYSTDANWTYYPESYDVVTDTDIGENFPRAHLIVRHLGATHSHDANGIMGLPFVSMGAQAGRGNSSNVGSIYGTPHKVKFWAKIWAYAEPSGGDYWSDGGLWFYLYALSEWGGKKRGVFLALKHLGDNTDASSATDAGENFLWNWTVTQSFFYPGVDWAFLDSEDLNAGPSAWHCGFTVPNMSSTGVDYQFNVDLKKLFQCASARGLFQQSMPSSGSVPISGVHWGNEMNGAGGYIWTSVHKMSMY
ncbi:hypothetical protein [Elongatibacter sediminis]|uniref:Uncharacterized protein n=1 Tax=Elongatibacter sediminis TaxID=3119006 RepID=A0AAW9R5T5_9GAMM